MILWKKYHDFGLCGFTVLPVQTHLSAGVIIKLFNRECHKRDFILSELYR